MAMTVKYDLVDKNGLGVTIEYHSDQPSFFSHEHEFAELQIVTSGHATHIVNGCEYRLSRGDVYVINRGTAHELLDSLTLKECLVQYKPEYLDSLNPQIKAMSAFQTLFVLAPRSPEASYACRLRLSPADIKIALSICARINSEIIARSPGYEVLVQALFTELVVFLCRKYSQPQSPDQKARSVLQISKVTSFIESSFREYITLDELCRQGDISKRHLTRLFKEAHGVSPFEYILRLRIEHAAHLLLSSGSSITEIAYSCGFDDSNYFSRQFKKHMGQSPREYRRS